MILKFNVSFLFSNYLISVLVSYSDSVGRRKTSRADENRERMEQRGLNSCKFIITHEVRKPSWEVHQAAYCRSAHTQTARNSLCFPHFESQNPWYIFIFTKDYRGTTKHNKSEIFVENTLTFL